MPPRHRLKLLASVLTSLIVSASTVASPISAEVLTTVSLDPTQKVHPLLQYGVQADATQLVRVIVQKQKKDLKPADVALLVPGLQVGEEFKNLPAFVATMPQTSVAPLAALPTIRYVSPDSSVQVIPSVETLPAKAAPKPPAPKPVAPPKEGFDSSKLLTSFPFSSGATKAWSGAAVPDQHKYSGKDIRVAVIDSGVDANHGDISGQVLAVNVNRRTTNAADGYGHGTHVSAIINGHDADAEYYGVAPSVTVISVKISDDKGQAYESDLLRGLDWVRTYRDAYHIKAVNLSVTSGVAAGYTVSPVDALAERLIRDDIAVVAAAGNLGSAEDAVWYAPANDPFVITVGCLDDNGTAMTTDDSLCEISSRGVTQDGFAKPDLVAPGRKIVSALSSGVNGQGSVLAGEFPDRITADGQRIRLSGTSMAAPVVTGAIALLLDRHGLKPNQLRQVLMNTATRYPGQPDGAGVLNIAAALVASDKAPSDDRYQPLPADKQAPPSGEAGEFVWDGGDWATAYFDGSRWGNAYWNGSRWGAATWDGSRWVSAYWNGARWGNAYWHGSRWGGATWDSAAALD